MNPDIVGLLYLAAGVLFILALRGLSNPESSRLGNMFGMAGMVIAVVTTLAAHRPAGFFAWVLVVLGLALGGSAGTVIARRVPMTAMPQLVAAFHSLVGLAAVLVAAAALYAPRAFDIRPLTYDLTPFVGLLTDGLAHEVRVHVAGVPAGQSGWFTVPNLHVWTDAHAKQTTGAITSYAVGELSKSDQVTGSNDGPGSVQTTAHRTLKISAYLNTSAGRIRTTVERTLANTSDHTWADGESHDASGNNGRPNGAQA